MIVEAPDESAVYDALVIGAGAVGLALGVTLARAGWRVLVAEGGGATLDPRYRERNAGLLSGTHQHLGLVRGRYKGLGGTTRLWGGQLMPFAPSDFAPDPANNKPGWPFDAEEIAPWIDRALALLGVPGGQDGVSEQWMRCAGGAERLGDDLAFAASVWMRHPDFTVHFGEAIRRNPALSIVTGHEAVGLVVDAQGGRVSGARFRQADRSARTIHARQTIMACGTFETARLLLRAQAALPECPLAANPHVGKWFVDHLHGIAGAIEPRDRAGIGALFDACRAGGHKLTPKLRLADAAMAREGLSSCAVTINTSFGPGEALHELRGLARRITGRGAADGESFAASARRAGAAVRVIAPLAWRYLRTRRSGRFIAGEMALGMELEQVPTPESYLYLESGVPSERARIGVHWSIDGREMRALAFAAKTARDALAAHGLAECTIDPRVLAEDPVFLFDCTDSSHQIGGARMAASAADGVTDGWGAVHGMPGLHVAGAATFPSGSFANPTLTAIATALRMGDRLTGEAR